MIRKGCHPALSNVATQRNTLNISDIKYLRARLKSFQNSNNFNINIEQYFIRKTNIT